MDKKKILFVDDEMDLVKLVSSRLLAGGYDVVTARDGREALDKIKKEKPELVILDLMLPKIDGHKVCALIKADTRYKKIPVIILRLEFIISGERIKDPAKTGFIDPDKGIGVLQSQFPILDIHLVSGEIEQQSPDVIVVD